MRLGFRLSLAYAGLLTLLACASGPVGVDDALRHGRMGDALFAYERGLPDLPALQRIAAVTLEQAAQSKDARASAQALAALERATPLTERVLVRLSERAALPAIRAGALATRARFGDRAARRALRDKLEDADADVRAVALETLDPESGDDTARLRLACAAPESVVRIAAIRRLARSSANTETLRVLSERARIDPVLAVRIAAVAALPAQAAAGVAVIEGLLEREQPAALRLAAVGALCGVDPARALARLARYLSDQPNAEGIEAARLLLALAPERITPADDLLAAARAQLERGLAAHDNAVRAAAAVALMSLAKPELIASLRTRAALERVRSVRLSLALALRAEDARGLLSELATRDDVVAAQASAELARRGDGEAAAHLELLAKHENPLVRRIAVRALGQDLGRAHALRAALLDRDSSVRIAAAAAILAAPATPRTALLPPA